MPFNDPLDAMEVTVYYCNDENADENTVGAVWTVLGYVTTLSLRKNRNERDVYNKRDKVCTKYGKNEFGGNLAQIYTVNTAGIYKLFNDALPVALKFALDKDMNGGIDETWYLSNVAFKNASIDFGNPNDGGADVTMSVEFSYTDDHIV